MEVPAFFYIAHGLEIKPVFQCSKEFDCCAGFVCDLKAKNCEKSNTTSKVPEVTELRKIRQAYIEGECRWPGMRVCNF